MEQNKRGRLWLTHKVWAGQVTQSVRCWHQPGDTQKGKAEKSSLDSPPLGLQVGKLKSGQGAGLVQEPAHLRTDRSILTKTDELNHVEIWKSFFFFLPVSLIVRIVASNQFPLFQQPQTLQVDNLKPRLTPTRSASVLKRTTPSRRGRGRKRYIFLPINIKLVCLPSLASRLRSREWLRRRSNEFPRM